MKCCCIVECKFVALYPLVYVLFCIFVECDCMKVGRILEGDFFWDSFYWRSLRHAMVNSLIDLFYLEIIRAWFSRGTPYWHTGLTREAFAFFDQGILRGNERQVVLGFHLANPSIFYHTRRSSTCSTHSECGKKIALVDRVEYQSQCLFRGEGESTDVLVLFYYFTESFY